MTWTLKIYKIESRKKTNQRKLYLYSLCDKYILKKRVGLSVVTIFVCSMFTKNLLYSSKVEFGEGFQICGPCEYEFCDLHTCVQTCQWYIQTYFPFLSWVHEFQATWRCCVLQDAFFVTVYLNFQNPYLLPVSKYTNTGWGTYLNRHQKRFHHFIFFNKVKHEQQTVY